MSLSCRYQYLHFCTVTHSVSILSVSHMKYYVQLSHPSSWEYAAYLFYETKCNTRSHTIPHKRQFNGVFVRVCSMHLQHWLSLLQAVPVNKVPFQYPIRRFVARSLEISKLRIWQAPQQHCQISKRWWNSKHKSSGFETFMWYWNRAQAYAVLTLFGIIIPLLYHMVVSQMSLPCRQLRWLLP